MDWDNDIPATVKRSARTCILENEQDLRSAYTEKAIRTDNSHIDHFRKQSLFPNLSLDWDNMLVDEHNGNYGADYKDDKIKKKEDYDGLFDPVADQPQQYFEYYTNGEIVPKNGIDENSRTRAERTIEVFNLNHPELVSLRANHIQNIINTKNGGLQADAIKLFLATYGFISVTEYYCQPDNFELL